jgi:hypothetical protein
MFMKLNFRGLYDGDLKSEYVVTDLVWIIATYHRDRVFPCLASEVKDLARRYGARPKDVVRAINIILSDEEDAYGEGEYA